MDVFLSPELQPYLILFALFFVVISFLNITVGLVFMTFAMIFSPEFSMGSVGFRSLTIRAEDILIPLLMFAWVARSALQKEFRLLVGSPLNIPLLAILIFSIFSAIRGVNTGSVREVTAPIFYIGKTMEFFAIFFLVLNYVRDEQKIRLFLFFVLLTLSAIGIYTLIQVPSVEIFTERRITGPFEGTADPGTMGGYMAFLLLIVFSLFLYEERPPLKVLYGLIGGIVIIPFIYTLNRTSYAALLGGLMFISFVERKRKWLVLLLISLILASPFWVPQPVKERIAFTWEDAVHPGRVMGVDSSSQGRVYGFWIMWDCVRWGANIIFGCGVGVSDNPDNQYSRTLHEIGPIGLGLWAWVFLRLFRISRWLFDSLKEHTLKGLVLGYRAGLVGILFHGLGSATLYTVRIMEPFWFITGLVVSLYMIRLGKEQALAGSLENVEARKGA